jgi:hypothetical protein
LYVDLDQYVSNMSVVHFSRDRWRDVARTALSTTLCHSESGRSGVWGSFNVGSGLPSSILIGRITGGGGGGGAGGGVGSFTGSLVFSDLNLSDLVFSAAAGFSGPDLVSRRFGAGSRSLAEARRFSAMASFVVASHYDIIRGYIMPLLEMTIQLETRCWRYDDLNV